MASATSMKSAAEQLLALPDGLEHATNFAETIGSPENRDVIVEGVWGSSCALLASAITRQTGAKLLIVCPDLSKIDSVAEDLALFTTDSVDIFPAWESTPEERFLHDEIYGQRLRLLKCLVNDEVPQIIVTSVESLLQPVPSIENVVANSRRISVGETLDPEEFARWLIHHKFHSTCAVELPGEFSLRGGILDIFAPDWNEPARVEFFGDEIESIRQFDIATQRSSHHLSQVEVTVLRHGKGEQGHFLDYLSTDTTCMLIELERMQDAASHYLDRLEDIDQAYSLPDTFKRLNPWRKVTVGEISSGSMDATCSFSFDSVEQFSGDVDRVRGELDVVAQGQDVFVVCRTEAEIERLEEIFSGNQLSKKGKLHYVQGALNQGFRYRDENVILISGDELFHRTTRARPKTKNLGKVIDSFLDLRENDLVVHLAHGIGRYRGLKLLERQGLTEEYLELEFHGGSKIFVPTSKVDLVQKYIGGNRTRVPLARLDGIRWKKQKEAVESSVKDMAEELLEVQAMRKSRPGIAFAQDTQWQREFDASFQYRPTNDQVTAIQAIKQDMEQPRPMDRLLCGDVGFGKTEVAMRAAFKAIDNGYQVAILVPTTILAEQHYNSFRQRMAEFPFTIEKLSRFCTPKEQRETVAGLKQGNVDLVVGTHRVASKDVAFQNLGLVIIDEEQRFGVEIKERLKQLRATVDVMTMTATPIPRTLHMSLIGVRDICNLESPPENRVAVETKVARFGDQLIRHAVLRELNRGGQIFFVHNRVQDIELIKAKLQRIVPEASIRIGHGQMPEHQLEEVMSDFIAGKFDLLLATTIVESGLDIPNANTIFIDEADRYGLADLHQLRGRVGRYKHRAYCYLLLEPGKHLSPVASKRLHAIEEFSQMGAGFAISMRDLEIRGAGNILGTQQSGHIAMVGYELYCKLLESAVRVLKRMPPKQSIDVDVDLPGEAYLPDTYVSDMRQKIDLYRRMTRIASDDDIVKLREEMLDRFGKPPKEVERLIELSALKLDAAFWQIASIFIEDEYLVLEYTDRGRIEQLAAKKQGKLRIVDDKSAYWTLPKKISNPDKLFDVAKSVLQAT